MTAIKAQSLEWNRIWACDNSALARPLGVNHIFGMMREILPGHLHAGFDLGRQAVGLERLRDQARWMHGAR